MRRIAIIGNGNVGGTLGRRWQEAGHNIIYGVREPHGAADQISVVDAVALAEVVILATPWSAVPDVLHACGRLDGKILVDCTNPIRSDFEGLTLGVDDSGGETVARLAPGAKVVKAFNTVGFNIMREPSFEGGPAAMLVAGDDAEAKTVVMALAEELGFQAADAGPLTQSRGLEAMAWLWISMAMKYGYGREFAFGLLTR